MTGSLFSNGQAKIGRGSTPASVLVFTKRQAPRPSRIFETYWRFAAERQDVFFRRVANQAPPWTEDEILVRHKFTNAYRASDRVSQYLIRNVIYSGDPTPREVVFRTLLFKIFNKIETWELLTDKLGEVRWSSFTYRAYERALSAALERRESIYSAAYIMPAPHFGQVRKHQNHLKLLESLMNEGVVERLQDARSLETVFNILRGCPSFGNFLAFQYAIDINYSEAIDFEEMEFVVPGPGALDGISKCFVDLGDYSATDVIRWTAERQEDECRRLGLNFQTLWGRPLQLIDCQNLFCEVDKYSRVAHPEVKGRTGRSRIKQAFRATPTKLDSFYPPKWKLNVSTGDPADTSENRFGASRKASERSDQLGLAL